VMTTAFIDLSACQQTITHSSSNSPSLESLFNSEAIAEVIRILETSLLSVFSSLISHL
jgi:hypothetical protein